MGRIGEDRGGLGFTQPDRRSTPEDRGSPAFPSTVWFRRVCTGSDGQEGPCARHCAANPSSSSSSPRARVGGAGPQRGLAEPPRVCADCATGKSPGRSLLAPRPPGFVGERVLRGIRVRGVRGDAWPVRVRHIPLGLGKRLSDGLHHPYPALRCGDREIRSGDVNWLIV